MSSAESHILCTVCYGDSNIIDCPQCSAECTHPRLFDDGICADCGFDTERESTVTKLMSQVDSKQSIPKKLYTKLNYLGLIPSDERSHNKGTSNYATKLIQPWSIFLDNPQLNYMECDLIKRILRTKSTDSRKLDYEKCIHILQELIRQEKCNGS